MKKETQNLLLAYMAACLNKMPEDWGGPKPVTGNEMLEALWPLNDVFRPHMRDVGALPYEAQYEQAADAAIEKFLGEGIDAWRELPAGVWRVLMERHTQSLVAATVNELAGNPMMSVPVEFPSAHLQGVAMIYMLHGMKLPYPVKPLSDTSFPPAGAKPGSLLH
ncbi:hypothetical protein GCM10007933_21260 [Zoogloea oryzae]|uniref:Uncharacterized protein n=1 Tax=Zoogloea oryzae TaxID=310767 RepID=A0ABQ6FDK2_9RHOO|nr:hypothetical protein [Zoogloea oryzae]GLT22666.1 hypothetical protein GCM10007933_21260 [Zoogloea oryzae]